MITGGFTAGNHLKFSFLPGVRLRRRAAGTGPNFVQAFHQICIQLDFQGAQAAIELVKVARANDGSRHNRVVQQPGQGHIGWLFA
jgi:hypothetical protein